MKNARNKTLGINIKAERYRKELSQYDLAEKVGVSVSSIGLIERGLQTPSAFLLFDISRVLGIDINELFKGIA